MTSTERAIYEHLRLLPVGMCPEAMAHELWMVVGPTIAPCSEAREKQ